ncbi:unnamed protein product [Rhizoctonia solani]|uniref:Uncharacterized protein n=1 Tax=Rhizoctonia solani TaxID=456999 RepID=A0A8H2X1S6_9AGAM|nr:unnamed protein product [Rhizoctonia solani]
MPAIRQHEASVSSSATSNGASHSSKSNGIGAKNVWFYMTGAKTPTRPHDDEIYRYFEADNLRQRTGVTYQRPQDPRIRCVVCLLEKDKWQTWHNRAGPIAKILRQHLDGRHAIVCTDDTGDQSAEPQPSAKPTSSKMKDKSEPSTSSGKSTPAENPHAPVEAPRPGRPKSVGQPPSPKFPTPSSSEESNPSKQVEISKPRPRAPKSVEMLRAELDRVKAEFEQVKADRDREARERRLLKEEVRRLKDAERARDEELLKVSNLLSSSLQALVKKQPKS